MKDVVLVLGSGGARGLSFVGALRVLKESGVTVTRVIGTSMGALIGAAYCCGTDIDQLQRAAVRLRLRDFLHLDLSGSGIFSAKGVQRIVSELVPLEQFEQLITPLSVVATDVDTGDPIVFTSGELKPPVAGSCLYAGLFDPVNFRGRRLVDGGYTNPLPVSVAPKDSIIIVVDPMVRPSWPIPYPKKPSIRNWIALNLMYLQFLKGLDCVLFHLSQEAVRSRALVHIVPALGEMKFSDFRYGKFAIDAGEVATRQKLTDIESALTECSS